MPSNVHSSTRDMSMSQPARGIGMNPQWQCMGCNEKRNSSGSRGVGIARRCAVCVAARSPVAKVCNQITGSVGAEGNP